MSDIAKDHDWIRKILEQPTEAFRHHAAIMEKLNRAGFRPNPVQQVDVLTERTDPKQMYINQYFSVSRRLIWNVEMIN